ncbi:MAG TPA: carboxypeptidase M32 [Pseudomonadales bacterium]
MSSGDNAFGYAALEQRFRELGDLGHAQAMLGWDEAVMMPSGGGERRGDVLATLAGVVHRQLTSPEVADLIAAATEETGLDDWQRANLREIRRRHLHATALPEALVVARSRQSTRCEQLWRTARAANDWRTIEGPLAELVRLTREMAVALGAATHLAPYDALIDQYQPGMDQARIDPIFAELRDFLPGFIDQVLERRPRHRALEGPIARSRQESLARALMHRIGFDFEHGRLDTSHHPFCGGDPDDTRITTRYDENDCLSSLMAVLHETGHALYEQGLPRPWRGLPVGEAAGTAVHESQSLLMEMQVCRGRDFVTFAAPLIREHLTAADASSDPAAWGVDNLYLANTHVSRGLIRVDADEVTYPLHVILRYEIERALLAGDLGVADLPAVWDAKMQRYLGRSTKDDYRDGCMQDVHWFCGLFGYFPTYTLGAVMAAQLFAAIRQQNRAAIDGIGRGDFAPLLAWLRRHVHGRGSLVTADQLLLEATGATLNTRAFKAHLSARYLDA